MNTPIHKFVLNLSYRPDRLESFQKNSSPFSYLSNVQRINAISGDLCNPPDYWTAGNGAWGCYKSHLNLMEQCLNEGTSPYIVFEDDAHFRDFFQDSLEIFFSNLPEDWDQVYLGGQLMHSHNRPPLRINPHVLRPFNVNRTHCYAVSRKGLLKIYQYLSRLPFHTHEHIDHHLGRWHESFDNKIYCPNVWSVGQHGSSSNVSGKDEEVEFYPDPISYVVDHWLYENSVCILYQSDPKYLSQCKFLHTGNSLSPKGFDVNLEEASKYKYPLPKVTEWYNWIRSECIQSKEFQIPCAYHPFLTEELLKEAGVKHVLVLEHIAFFQEIEPQVKRFVNSVRES